VSKYGTFDRLWVGIVDLAGVAWLQRRWRRPVVEGDQVGETAEFLDDSSGLTDSR
jgi:hypothetical protein